MHIKLIKFGMSTLAAALFCVSLIAFLEFENDLTLMMHLFRAQELMELEIFLNTRPKIIKSMS